jgi:rSAM/selenodomain-associated transferase 1
MQPVLGVFAKEPRPGSVKSRLAASIGDEEAAQLYAAFLTDLLARFRCVPARRVIAFTPDTALAHFQKLAGGFYEVEPQVRGDLGVRMSHFFRSHCDGGTRSVVLVGSDTPHLPARTVADAFDRLRSHPVVLGPCDDGGYYLIGMNRYVPEIFDGIEWSTSNVFRQTLGRLESAGLAPSLLDPMFDVDRVEDLQRLVEFIDRERAAGRDHGLASSAELAARLART